VESWWREGDFLQSSFHAELLGCLEGLKMAASMGMTHIVMETGYIVSCPVAIMPLGMIYLLSWRVWCPVIWL
jgi:hypothetical protein